MVTRAELDHLFTVVKLGRVELANNNVEDNHACFIPIVTGVLHYLQLSNTPKSLKLQYGTNIMYIPHQFNNIHYLGCITFC